MTNCTYNLRKQKGWCLSIKDWEVNQVDKKGQDLSSRWNRMCKGTDVWNTQVIHGIFNRGNSINCEWVSEHCGQPYLPLHETSFYSASQIMRSHCWLREETHDQICIEEYQPARNARNGYIMQTKQKAEAASNNMSKTEQHSYSSGIGEDTLKNS